MLTAKQGPKRPQPIKFWRQSAHILRQNGAFLEGPIVHKSRFLSYFLRLKGQELALFYAFLNFLLRNESSMRFVGAISAQLNCQNGFNNAPNSANT